MQAIAVGIHCGRFSCMMMCLIFLRANDTRGGTAVGFDDTEVVPLPMQAVRSIAVTIRFRKFPGLFFIAPSVHERFHA
jgi:hypothetical protein